MRGLSVPKVAFMVHEFSPPRPRRARRSAAPVLTLAILAFGVWTGARMLDAPTAPAQAAKPAARPPAPSYARQAPAPAYAALLDPSFPLGAAPARFGESAPRAATWDRPAEPALAKDTTAAPAPAEIASNAPELPAPPAPPPRPAELAQPALAQPLRATVRLARQTRAREAQTIVAKTQPAQEPSFFEKLFGGGASAPGPALAYAPREESPREKPFAGARRDPGGFGVAARYDGYTAVYDISARTVYMPDGTRLEAHSGLGPKMDDPRHVHVRMHGATPPHVYNLRMREAPFHGVRAIRLLPMGGAGAIFGRAGLLAHTYMLGPRGDSNGCVSFRDYAAFLRAFESGQIRRLAVVANL